MDKQKEVLDLAVRVGEVLLQNGGEIFRVQETMRRIAEAYGVGELHVYVLANGLFASVDDTEGTGAQYVRHLETGEEIGQSAGGSQVRYIPLSATHLGRVAAVNDLSRQIAAHKYTIEEAWKRIEEISVMPFINEKIQILMSGLGAATICIIMGGSFWDSVASLISGILLWCFILYHSRKKSNKIMVNILGSALVTLNGIIMFRFFFGDNMDKIIIGSIAPMLPGSPFTNSIRDFLNGDYLSGTIRMIDAILVGCCIALGVGLVLRIVTIVFGITL